MKLSTSIVKGISVFLSLVDQLEVAILICPPPPRWDDHPYIDSDRGEAGPDEEDEAAATALPIPALRRRLPPLGQLIESGKVVALNMPAGANRALGRTIGILLENA